MNDNILKIIDHLWKSEEEASVFLSPVELEQKRRILALHSMWLASPWKENNKLMEAHSGVFNISQAQAYRDFDVVKTYFGNIKLTSKDLMRYIVEEMCKRAYEKAETEGNAMAMVAAANGIIKVRRLDQEDKELDPEDIHVPNFQATVDPMVIGLQPIKNKAEKVAKYREKFITNG